MESQPAFPVVLSHLQAAVLLAARHRGAATASVSPDLGLTSVTVALTAAGVCFPTGERVGWEELARAAVSPTKCFLLEDGGLREIRVHSRRTGWVRSLMPTAGAPTMLVSGIPMHRIKDIDPWQDTLAKVRAVAPVVGRVLDTATGLGYTAIAAARTAAEVVTIELDPAALAIARLNPWSRPLFTDPKIVRLVGDTGVLVRTFPAGHFARVIHDPPTLSLAGELYSAAFYGELFRVLGRGGRLFHYVGDPDSRSGRAVTAGVVRRLTEAGFRRVVRRPQAFGVVALK
jgi:predicted methyltransferase